MAQYIITYLGGEQPSSPEEGKQHFAKYKKWLSSLGDSAVSPANPFKNTRTVNSDGSVTTGSTTSMSGYTLIEDASLETALGEQISAQENGFWISVCDVLEYEIAPVLDGWKGLVKRTRGNVH